MKKTHEHALVHWSAVIFCMILLEKIISHLKCTAQRVVPYSTDVLKSAGQGTIQTATPGANGIPIALIALFDAGEKHEQ